MIICLVRPEMYYLLNPHMYGPIGLWSLSAYIKAHIPGAQCTVVELPAPIPEADVVGWTATSIDYDGVVARAKQLRSERPRTRQVLGGPHASVMLGQVDPVFDAVFVGEGERSFTKWLLGKASFTTPRVIYPEPVCDLDTLPYPDRPYYEEWVTIVGSRGCPYKCPFCATQTLWPKFRSRSAANVADEMLSIAKLGHKRFNLADDTPRLFMSDDGLVFAEKLKGLGIEWRAQARVDQVVKHPERLSLLKKAGCVELCFGVESFDPAVLSALSKGTTPAMIVEALCLTHAAGIHTRAYMMIGTPGETWITPHLNITALEKLCNVVDVVNLQTFMPMPGTPIWNDPEKYGIEIVNKEFSKYNRFVKDALGERPIWTPIRIKGESAEQIEHNIKVMRNYIAERGKSNVGG